MHTPKVVYAQISVHILVQFTLISAHGQQIISEEWNETITFVCAPRNLIQFGRFEESLCADDGAKQNIYVQA